MGYRIWDTEYGIQNMGYRIWDTEYGIQNTDIQSIYNGLSSIIIPQYDIGFLE